MKAYLTEGPEEWTGWALLVLPVAEDVVPRPLA